ncbi:ParB/RepB/Spo0J family partition protein [Desulfovibrio sp. JC010]|uniref:ParB/RepB/Spo0J family partition protein n=1 Tax=Desulfovibrio sp. JC010 TaxID=2593641 RepID=UPI0013D64005|nr:ParB/RepB/Spo0J family partition protein [Desulfovibrio sp. JC010]NDV26201.1 ParB/RepB/Spo0J family partition protein [Desulfovibrio sp. JC010]
MAGVTGGLGRGLDALLGGGKGVDENSASEASIDARQIDIDMIVANPNQPRKEFSPEALKDLSESIRAKGVLQPVLVRPVLGRKDRFELVAGERRLRASKLAGLGEIPALVKEMTDLESMAIALIENLQREDLNPIEEAKGYQELITKFGLSQEQLAGQVGKSRSALSNSMRLLTLSEPVQDAIGNGKISAGHGRALMAVADDAARDELFDRLMSSGLSVRQCEGAATYFKEHGELPEGEVVAKPKPGKSKKKEPKEIDEDLEILKSRLEEALETKVSFSGSQKKGKLTISYADEQELERLVAILELRS